MGISTRNEVETSNMVFFQMSYFGEGIEVFVDGPRIEERLVLEGQIWVGGKEGVCTNEIH